MRRLRSCGRAALILVGLVSAAPGASGEDYRWQLPPGFPVPLVPADNPMSEAKVALGRLLFYETRLSATGTHACATCHQQRHAFSDGRARALGATGDEHPRSAMALVNVAYNPAFLWADPRVRTLEEQARRPLYNEHPVEMGFAGRQTAVLAELSVEERYADLFTRAFPADPDPVRVENLLRALASFERTLISGRSRFDRFVFDDDRDALGEDARRGMTLFYSGRVGCAACHFGINFSGPVVHAESPDAVPLFANTALFNVDGKGRYPSTDRGVEEVSRRSRDHGRFRVPTLRNIAITAPYMHDGSIATLSAVLDHYAAAGRQAPLGPVRRNHHRDRALRAFTLTLTLEERAALIAFIESLTDEAFVSDARFAEPGAGDGIAPSIPAAGANVGAPPAR